MNYLKGFRHFRKVFFLPRVFVFILTWVGFMFLTFFTHENATELEISGIASIFIGIGVNNFTAIETEQQEERKLQRKTLRAVKALVHIQGKVKKIERLAGGDAQLIISELKEMNDYVDLCVQYLEEE